MTFRHPDVEVVKTEDGSQTLLHVDLGVTYRSTHGAHEESRYVFVAGTYSEGTRRGVLELGLGAGTNLALTIDHARQHAYELDYVVFEHAPIRMRELDFGQPANRILDDLLKEGSAHAEGMKFTLYVDEWGARSPGRTFDSVYFDPFGPRVDDVWTEDAFTFARDHMHDASILGTYSAASSVKRAMGRAGLHIATAPGPGRKREITFAARTVDALRRYDLLDRERYL